MGNYLYSHQDGVDSVFENIENIDGCWNTKQWYMRAVGKRGRIHAEEVLKEIVEA